MRNLALKSTCTKRGVSGEFRKRHTQLSSPGLSSGSSSSGEFGGQHPQLSPSGFLWTWFVASEEAAQLLSAHSYICCPRNSSAAQKVPGSMITTHPREAIPPAERAEQPVFPALGRRPRQGVFGMVDGTYLAHDLAGILGKTSASVNAPRSAAAAVRLSVPRWKP